MNTYFNKISWLALVLALMASLKAVVLLHLKAIGEASALKNAKFKIDGEKTVADVEKFLQKQLKYEGALVS